MMQLGLASMCMKKVEKDSEGDEYCAVQNTRTISLSNCDSKSHYMPISAIFSRHLPMLSTMAREVARKNRPASRTSSTSNLKKMVIRVVIDFVF